MVQPAYAGDRQQALDAGFGVPLAERDPAGPRLGRWKVFRSASADNNILYLVK